MDIYQNPAAASCALPESLPRLPRIPLRGSIPQRRAARAQRLEVLRKAAREAGREQCRPFYPMRVVAAHFGVSATTIARYYETLKAEGLLSSAWGVETVARRAEFNEERRVRGIIALPVFVRCVAAIAHERTLVTAIQDKLWAAGFAARMVFHEQAETNGRRFAELLLGQGVDGVVWGRPPASAATTAAILQSHGLPVVSVDSACDHISSRHYAVDRTAAMTSILRQWRRDAVSSFAIAIANEAQTSDGIVSDLYECADELQLRCKQAVFSDTTPEMFLESLSRSRGGVVLPSSRFALSLAEQAPAQFDRLLQSRRVMLPEGPFDFLSSVDMASLADVLHVRWESLAKRIVDDLIMRRAPTGRQPLAHATPSPAWTQKAA